MPGNAGTRCDNTSFLTPARAAIRPTCSVGVTAQQVVLEPVVRRISRYRRCVDSMPIDDFADRTSIQIAAAKKLTLAPAKALNDQLNR